LAVSSNVIKFKLEIALKLNVLKTAVHIGCSTVLIIKDCEVTTVTKICLFLPANLMVGMGKFLCNAETGIIIDGFLKHALLYLLILAHPSHK
jgi:hypothetical protein